MSDPWWAPPGDDRRGSGRTWTLRGAATALATAVVLVGAATVGVTSPHTPDRTTTGVGFDVRPTVAALARGCGPTRFVTDPASKVGTVRYTGELGYWPVVPVSGWFAAERAATDDPDATPEQVLHGMWFGDRVIWVAADTRPQLTAALRALVAANPQWGAVLRAWPADRRNQLDPGTYSPAAWGVTQSCEVPDAAVITALFAAAPPAPGRGGHTPAPAFGSSADAP
jgi:hypothetical protein